MQKKNHGFLHFASAKTVLLIMIDFLGGREVKREGERKERDKKEEEEESGNP